MTTKINGTPATTYVPPVRSSNDTKAGSAAATTSSSVGPGDDSLSLTDSALLLQQASTDASAASGFDQAKVDAASRALQNGSYRVDPQAIAAKLMKTEAEIYG